METLKRKLRVVFALVAAAVVLLGLGFKDALAQEDLYSAYSKPGCETQDWHTDTVSMVVIIALIHANLVRSFQLNGGLCTDVSPST